MIVRAKGAKEKVRSVARKLVVILFLAVMVAVLVSSAMSAVASKPVVRQPTMAIAPLQIEGAKEGTKAMLPDLYKTLFETKGFDTMMGVPVEQAMSKLGIRSTGVPTDSQLLAIGESLGVDYILSASYKFNTKKVWIHLVPKSRTILTIESHIINVSQKALVYDKKTETYQRADSKYQDGVGLVLSYPVAIFMGGSLSSAEKGAAVKSLETTYGDFFLSLVRTSSRVK